MDYGPWTTQGDISFLIQWIFGKVHIMFKFLDIRDCLFPDTVIHFLNETEVISIYPHRIFGNYFLESGIDSCLLSSKPFLQIFECPYSIFLKIFICH